MADEAYRAVFLRIHPTGKMVLSLTTEADGKEGEYAEQIATELGVPALDVKVVPADENRFGTGHGFNTSPSAGTAAAISSATGKIRAKAQLLAGMALEMPSEQLSWDNGAGLSFEILRWVVPTPAYLPEWIERVVRNFCRYDGNNFVLIDPMAIFF